MNSNGIISELKLVSDGDMKLVPGSAAGSTGSTKTLIIDSTAAIKVPVGTSIKDLVQHKVKFVLILRQEVMKVIQVVHGEV